MISSNPNTYHTLMVTMNMKCFCLVLLKICLTQCTVLLWSNKQFDVLPLQKFNDDDLNVLLEKMAYPEVVAYNNPNQNIPSIFKELISGSYSAYNTNENLESINSTELAGNEKSDFMRIKDEMDYARQNHRNTLFLIISGFSHRIKREVDDEELITDGPILKEPVVYIGKSKTGENYGLIYSSSPLLLQINGTDLYIGETSPDMVSVDTVPRESITRLNINKPQSDGRKITFRFIFLWADSYWYLTSVRITDTSSNNIAYNLTVDKEITAPVRFSYHCSGKTVFSDFSNNIYLYLSDMQVQIDSKTRSFDDAFDCIAFTTIPIWSGILVSSLLIIVLMLSLLALGDIKTMDKFDNHKTKQLAITIHE